MKIPTAVQLTSNRCAFWRHTRPPLRFLFWNIRDLISRRRRGCHGNGLAAMSRLWPDCSQRWWAWLGGLVGGRT